MRMMMLGNHWTNKAPQRMRLGFSLVEVLVAVAIMGILAAITIVRYGETFEVSKDVVAQNSVETLNGAMNQFTMNNYELLFPALDISGQDELLVLRTLQYRDSRNPKTGSPYMRDDWNPVISNSTADHRIVWTGNLYKLVPPGVAGIGLKVDFTGGDLGTPFVFPPDFSTVGR